MTLDLRHEGLFHTNGRLGLFFAQTEIEVVQLIELCGDLESSLCGDAGSIGTSGCGYEAREQANILQGNSISLKLMLSSDGQLIDNLGQAISGAFQLLGRTDNHQGVFKTLASMSIDDPEPGMVTIQLNSNETDLLEGAYDPAIQFTWGPGDSLEWMFTKTLNFIRDTIIFP